jgi:hydrogenase/urease accessory protein HupE
MRRNGLQGAIERAVASVALMAVMGVAGSVAAHPLAPSMLEVTEHAEGRVDVVWKTPLLQPRGGAVEPILPERCVPMAPPRVQRESDAIVLRWSAECGAGGLVGARIDVAGLATGGTDALVRIVPLEGPSVQALLSADRDHFVVPAQQVASEVAREYLELGFDHIVGGPDHLLFVLGLVLLLPAWRRLVPVVTAFTVGHSVTLALVTLGVVRIAPGPVEVAIAASILVLALRLCRERAESESGRVPLWALAGVFGLLHGLGFAGALADVGLPAAEIPLALLAFNVGIELGQLLFVAALLALGAAIRALPAQPPRSWARVPAYAMGSLAAFWCLQRTAGLI